MRALLAGLALALCLVSPASSEDITQSAAHRPLTQQLIRHERDAWAAYSRRDTSAPNRLAQDYSDLQADGTVLDAAGHLAFVPEANLASYELDQFRVFRLSPESAIVAYRARTRENTPSGPGPTATALVTSAWALRGGRWLNVFYRETAAP